MDNEKLINEYINSLTLKVNELQQENLLLKSRMNLTVKDLEERVEVLQRDLQDRQEEIINLQTSQVKAEEPVIKKPATPTFKAKETVKEIEPEVTAPNVLIRAPRPKGYNAKVDGPRKLIPNPIFEDKDEAYTN